jgi:TatA/E family protein of Tat protein translocase
MFGLRPTELLLILLIVLVLFGAKKLPQLGQGLGQALRGFKKAVNTDEDEGQSALPPRQQTPEQQQTQATEPTKTTVTK